MSSFTNEQLNTLTNDHLLVKCLNVEALGFYKDVHHEQTTDSGYDLYYCGPNVIIDPWTSKRLNMGIACQIEQIHGYDLRSRSSIDKTPLQLSNGIGTIDYGYRGEILASFRNLSPEPYTVKHGARLCQLTMPSLMPFRVTIVSDLDDTSRGSGGFGSTGP